jgi:hypothetical protein
MLILKCALAVCCGVPESATCTVIANDPATVGVPLIAPVLEFSDSPAANWPDVIDHVYGVVPPDAANWVL